MWTFTDDAPVCLKNFLENLYEFSGFQVPNWILPATEETEKPVSSK